MKASNAQSWGIALIVVGVFLLVGNMAGVDIGDLISTWWPLILVVWGLTMLFRGSRTSDPSKSTKIPEAGAGAVSSDQLAQSSVFGDATIRVSSQSFRGGSLSTVFGDSDVDLRQCVLAEGEHWLRVSGVFGDTEILIPQTMAVSVTASTTFGDVQITDQKREGFAPALNYESPEFSTASRRLHVQTSQIFGDVTVRS